MAAELTLVRIQAEGQVALPASVTKRLGLKTGDQVAVEETPEGVLIMPRGVAAVNALTDIGDALREQGLTLEDMIERGKTIREDLYRQQYGTSEPDTS
jgi:AbrB family looped-hinge helix DNA binding protein